MGLGLGYSSLISDLLRDHGKELRAEGEERQGSFCTAISPHHSGESPVCPHRLRLPSLCSAHQGPDTPGRDLFLKQTRGQRVPKVQRRHGALLPGSVNALLKPEALQLTPHGPSQVGRKVRGSGENAQPRTDSVCIKGNCLEIRTSFF